MAMQKHEPSQLAQIMAQQDCSSIKTATDFALNKSLESVTSMSYGANLISNHYQSKEQELLKRIKDTQAQFYEQLLQLR